MSTKDDGSPGDYVQADLGALDEVIGGWQTQGDDIRADGTLLSDAYYGLQPPCNDVITAEYFATLSSTFGEFYRHNDAMVTYTAGYVERLVASRQQMAVAEAENAVNIARGGDI